MMLYSPQNQRPAALYSLSEKRTDRLVPLNSLEDEIAKMVQVADQLERTQKKPTKLAKKEKQVQASHNFELGLRFPLPDGLVTTAWSMTFCYHYTN
jgi:hypothetical protein